MTLLVFAAVGGAIGAGLRFLIIQLFASPQIAPGAIAFPWPTIIVNVVGGLLMGLVFVLINDRLGGSAEWRAFLATGVLGGFTTFSAYSLDMMNLLTDDGLSLRFFAYTIGSVILAFAALAVGMWAARGILT